MVLMTLIARVADALPLAASMQEDEQVKLNRVKLSSSRDTHVNAIYVSGSSDRSPKLNVNWSVILDCIIISLVL